MIKNIFGIRRSKELREFGNVIKSINKSKYFASKQLLEGWAGPEIENIDDDWHLREIDNVYTFSSNKPHYNELADSLKNYLEVSKKEIQEFKRYLSESNLIHLGWEQLQLNRDEFEKSKPKTFEEVYGLARKIKERLEKGKIDLSKVKVKGIYGILQALNN